MTTEERIEQQRHLVETLGRRYEIEGMQPVAGRIMALLMVMDKEQFTFDEIVEELQISKSSASVALKNLQLRHVVEYITQPGDRKRYFRIKSQEPFYLIEEFKKDMEERKKLLIEILNLKADPNSRNSKFYKDLMSIMDFFLDNFDKLKAEYEKSRKS